MGEVRSNARLTIVGEAPGGQEVREGTPFVGPSGAELNLALEAGGLTRTDCTVTNVLLCRPPAAQDGESVALEDYLEELNKKYKAEVARAEREGLPMPRRPLSPLDACRPRLEADIAKSASKTILAVGGKALQAMAQHFNVPYGTGADTVGQVALATIKAQHGSPMTMPDGRILCSSLHPAFAMRKNRQFTQIIRDNITRAAMIVARGHRIDWAEPTFGVFVPAKGQNAQPHAQVFADIAARIARVKAAGNLVAVDIETDSADSQHCLVRCVGIGSLVDGKEEIFSVPLRWMDGRRYWGDAKLEAQVCALVRDLLDTATCVFHNGLFDTAVLLRVGLMTNARKRWLDTMLGHHDTDANDLEHGLGFVARQFLEAPLWKKDVDHKAAAGVALDYDLHLYNSKDVLITLRLWPLIESRILACGTLEQFKTDTHLAPIARDMGRLGLFIDEEVRGELSLKFNELCVQLRAKFQQLTGKPNLNPRSPPQLKAWLYGELGMTRHDSQGFEVDDDDAEEASTGNAALFKIIDLLAPDGKALTVEGQQIIDAINCLLEFRACDKLRGTYIDNLRVSYDYEVSPWERSKSSEEVAAAQTLAAVGAIPSVPAVTYNGSEILPSRPAISRLFIGWKIHTVPSGRWTCDPTVHNWPSRGWMVEGKPVNMRKMVIAPPGHKLVGADYEQLELRAYGVVADDKYVIKAFKDELEPHCLNAATIFAEKEADIWPTYQEFVRKHFHPVDKSEASEIKFIRTVAKRVAYLKNYGGEADKLYSAMAAERDKATNKRVFPKLDKKRVDEWERRWDERHPETKRWHERVARTVRSQGFVSATVLRQRKRYFIGGPNKKNAPPNHEIQGSGAEFANEAVIRLEKRIPFGCWSPYTGLCLQVHDYLGLYVPDEKVAEACEILEDCMYFEMQCADGWMMPFPAKAVASYRWSDNA